MKRDLSTMVVELAKLKTSNFIQRRLLAVATSREPDLVIGGRDDPYLLRWWLTPWSKYYRDIPDSEKTLWQKAVRALPNLYLHLFLRSDDASAMHDHPWLFNFSYRIMNGYDEHFILAGGVHIIVPREQGSFTFHWGAAPHRVQLRDVIDTETFGRLQPCWTLFGTGPMVRKWGFHCPSGWVPFTSGRPGRRCD